MIKWKYFILASPGIHRYIGISHLACRYIFTKNLKTLKSAGSSLSQKISAGKEKICIMLGRAGVFVRGVTRGFMDFLSVASSTILNGPGYM